MALDAQILARVLSARLTKSVRREAAAAARRDEIFAKLPRAADIDTDIRTQAIDAARSAVTDGENAVSFDDLKARTDAARAELQALLADAGYPPDALDAGYDCPHCRDSGYSATRAPCSCLISDYAEAQLRELSETLPVTTQTFGKFSLDLFSPKFDPDWGISPRENIQGVRDICREFAEKLEPSSHNLLLSGPPGTGKTYLASCVAAELSQHGHSVLYRSAADIVTVYERAKFTYDSDALAAAESEISRYARCDLLILDDLGGEFKAPFVNTALLSLLDTRLKRGKKLLICTCLDEEKELPARYSPQIVSRLRGDFLVLPLFGGDLRALER